MQTVLINQGRKVWGSSPFWFSEKLFFFSNFWQKSSVFDKKKAGTRKPTRRDPVAFQS